jgi:putative hydrolase of the HAD superfamily
VVAPPQHVLLDADGILQELPVGWLERMRPYLGERAEGFLPDTWHDDRAALRGEADFMETLAAEHTARGLPTTAAQLVPAVAHSIEVHPESMRLVRRLQEAGYAVHLGSNQERHRADFMARTLGYDHVFTTSVYSCRVGHAKPEPAYFTAAAALIGAEPHDIVFVDDRLDNVEGARAAGLRAEQWEADESRDDLGIPDLVALLREHGISLDA